ncbi:2-oxoglutarate ferredoxin oxidoreductase subunit alpha [Polycladomyces abyssicola]|uniref:2-oxoglutarate ferredoxin oxidoreductase subunit alpha n=1 Tax=Polycladomyces abyssicola TaxID=1125966 RepID=A0A8D5ZN28_9BACL|nr:2-oxoacid:acceptor oxidoreductase subunit alpha [Polycladomyces abyssicola]BCU82305.1 2-oxoglutarate ferredoxin oxidoreductase subunit alpha [Polycladomyces abyssicola]
MATLTWKVGGAQGEGIDSTGDIFATTLNRLGYYLFTYRHFMSLIKGGHTNYKVRVAESPVRYHGDDLDILVAFDQRTIDENAHELTEDSVLIYDSGKLKSLVIPDGIQVKLCPVPVTDMAKELGSPIMKNMVASGVSAAIVGLSADAFDSLIEERFGKKGDSVVESNKAAVRAGFEFTMERYGVLKQLPNPQPADDGGGHLFISGNEAVGLGALAAGCRFLAAYPITPATEIMYTALAHFPRYGGKVLQAEDEIAACIMAIGANYAGVRAMTSTSGPGISLMQEAIGLAGISETPLVIVDVMRGGPGTGLPTKTEQSDLNELVYGSHGEIPRIVLTPSTVEECFYYTAEAFNLAEKYQCPVIVATDLYLGMSKQSVPVGAIDFEKVTIDRGELISDEELLALAPGEYRRYAVTESGISKRSIPGQKNGRFVAMSNEHDEGANEEIEDPETRVQQMAKRMRKLNAFDPSVLSVEYDGPETTKWTLVGFGSTRAQIGEAVKHLQDKGVKVGHLQIKVVKPFPDALVKRYLSGAERILVVENNATGQLAELIRARVGFHDRIQSCLKFSGDPFTVEEILAHCKLEQGVGL